LKLQAISVERRVLNQLLQSGYISGSVYTDYELQLDLQHDVIEHMEIFDANALDEDNNMVTGLKSYRKRLKQLLLIVSRFPLASKILGISEEQVLEERYSLIRARIICDTKAINFLQNIIMSITKTRSSHAAIKTVLAYYERLREKNRKELSEMQVKHKQLLEAYQLSEKH